MLFKSAVKCQKFRRISFSFLILSIRAAAERPEIKSSTGRLIGLEGIEEAVVRIGQDLQVVEGVIVRLICPVNRGFPKPQVTWYLNDRPITPSERFLNNTRSIDSLTVNGIHLQDTGQVSCVAINTAGQARESSFIRNLGKDKLSSFEIFPIKIECPLWNRHPGITNDFPSPSHGKMHWERSL